MRAKAVCSSCPVIQRCLRWALEAREPYGVWGGLSVDEREALIAKRTA
jgi:WhiB family redox-sensing transcriptional regulator